MWSPTWETISKRVAGVSPAFAGALVRAHRQCLLFIYAAVHRFVVSHCAHACAHTIHAQFSCGLSLLKTEKASGSNANFLQNAFCFLAHSAQIVFHSVINSTHFYSPTYSYQPRKNRVVQSFRKRFHSIIRSNDHR